jgi:hypothetical protein
MLTSCLSKNNTLVTFQSYFEVAIKLSLWNDSNGVGLINSKAINASCNLNIPHININASKQTSYSIYTTFGSN